MTFREREKIRYQTLKPEILSTEARREGMYRKISRSFCISDEFASENLHRSIRAEAIEYFATRRITWHDGLAGGALPSNHLCCSQSCCVNFLFPMTINPQLLSATLGKLYPDFAEPLDIPQDGPLGDGRNPYLAFEWIGTKDYLTEWQHKSGTPTRGANYTSADFAFRFRMREGGVHLVLGEWKYTEQCGVSDLGTAKNPKDKSPERRRATYPEAFNREGGVLAQYGEDLYSALFYEPFYQLMRLQLLAQEMELRHELDADVVTVLHACPDANTEFNSSVTSPTLASRFPGKGVTDIWRSLVPERKFKSVSVEAVRNAIVTDGSKTDPSWAKYIGKRYGW